MMSRIDQSYMVNKQGIAVQVYHHYCLLSATQMPLLSSLINDVPSTPILCPPSVPTLRTQGDNLPPQFPRQPRDSRLKLANRVLRCTIRLAGLPLAAYTTTVMGITLHKYSSTINTYRSDPPRSPWPKQPSLWPPVLVLVLALSAVSLTFTVSTAVAYAFAGVTAANRVASMSTTICIWNMVRQLVLWAFLAVV
jgi:hypothetical protein